MKKIFYLFLLFILLIPSIVKAENDLAPNSRNSILVEVNSGEILFEKNKDERVAVASLTKMMSQIIILENIENKTLTWDEEVTASSNAAGFGGTQIYLQPGEKMTVRDLMKAISMASANDATVVLAERIAGSEEAFVKMMMDKVNELGLQNTNFVNCTGLDQDGNYSSAYDLSIIARELMKHEQIFKFTSVYEDYLRVDTPNKFWLVNTNKLVHFYEGADGLKTGFTDSAKYCMAVTSKRNNMRLLAIVLGEDVSKTRNQETTELLNYGFNLYEIQMLRKKGEVIDKLNLDKASVKNVNIVLKDDISFLKKKNDISKNYKEEIELDNIKLPLKKDDKVGKLKVLVDNEVIGEYDLIVNNDVNKKSFIKMYFDSLKSIISGKIM